MSRKRKRLTAFAIILAIIACCAWLWTAKPWIDRSNPEICFVVAQKPKPQSTPLPKILNSFKGIEEHRSIYRYYAADSNGDNVWHVARGSSFVKGKGKPSTTNRYGTIITRKSPVAYGIIHNHKIEVEDTRTKNDIWESTISLLDLRSGKPEFSRKGESQRQFYVEAKNYPNQPGKQIDFKAYEDLTKRIRCWDTENPGWRDITGTELNEWLKGDDFFNDCLVWGDKIAVSLKPSGINNSRSKKHSLCIYDFDKDTMLLDGYVCYDGELAFRNPDEGKTVSLSNPSTDPYLFATTIVVPPVYDDTLILEAMIKVPFDRRKVKYEEVGSKLSGFVEYFAINVKTGKVVDLKKYNETGIFDDKETASIPSDIEPCFHQPTGTLYLTVKNPMEAKPTGALRGNAKVINSKLAFAQTTAWSTDIREEYRSIYKFRDWDEYEIVEENAATNPVLDKNGKLWYARWVENGGGGKGTNIESIDIAENPLIKSIILNRNVAVRDSSNPECEIIRYDPETGEKKVVCNVKGIVSNFYVELE